MQSDRLLANRELRMRHLAQVLELLHKIYSENKELYGDAFLAFVGDKIVRNWPWIDMPIVSRNALRVLEDAKRQLDLQHVPFTLRGVHRAEFDHRPPKQEESKIKEALAKALVYEHVTPITFFRDVLRNYPPVAADVYFLLLKENYRVAWVTKAENAALNKKRWKSCRPVNAYRVVEPPIDLQ